MLQESDPAIRFRGAWHDHSAGNHSGGAAKLAMDAGSRAVLRFRGTGVSWIGYRDEWSGIARVMVDGKARRVDTYANPADPQSVIHSVTGLPNGKHRLVIRVTGRKSARSDGSWVWVDALEVIR